MAINQTFIHKFLFNKEKLVLGHSNLLPYLFYQDNECKLLSCYEAQMFEDDSPLPHRLLLFLGLLGG